MIIRKPLSINTESCEQQLRLNTCHSRGRAGVRACVRDSHVRISCRTFDVQVHRHVAPLAVIQPIGSQAEVQLWGPLHLKHTHKHTRPFHRWPTKLR